jgi:putative redox protein
MKISARWVPPMRFDATTESSPGIVMDATPDHGGTGAGPSPMEAVLMAMAGCTGMDVASLLRKMRVPCEALTIEIEAERAAEHPRVFTKIHVRYVVVGPGLTRDPVEKAVALSLDKYCSVTAMLRRTATVTSEIILAPGPVPG